MIVSRSITFTFNPRATKKSRFLYFQTKDPASCSLSLLCSHYSPRNGHHHDKKGVCFSSSSSSSSFPFYGRARPPSSRYNSMSSSFREENENHHRASWHYSHYPHHPSSSSSKNSSLFSLPPLTPLQRVVTFLHSSFTALNDPTRADAVGAVGEVTGSYALSKIRMSMLQDEIGRRILLDKPLVDDSVANRAFTMLHKYNNADGKRRSMNSSSNNDDDDDNNNNNNNSEEDSTKINYPNANTSSTSTIILSPCDDDDDDDNSSSSRSSSSSSRGEREDKRMPFGVAYAKFLQKHAFDPNERSSVRYISDPELAYIMTRYRQCHDYWHVVSGLPPTVLGELALKWVELLQTGLPLAALSVTGGAWGIFATTNYLSEEERDVLYNVYFPWAVRVGTRTRPHTFLCTYYEEEFETELVVLRERMGIEPAPIVY